MFSRWTSFWDYFCKVYRGLIFEMNDVNTIVIEYFKKTFNAKFAFVVWRNVGRNIVTSTLVLIKWSSKPLTTENYTDKKVTSVNVLPIQCVCKLRDAIKVAPTEWLKATDIKWRKPLSILVSLLFFSANTNCNEKKPMHSTLKRSLLEQMKKPKPRIWMQ